MTVSKCRISRVLLALALAVVAGLAQADAWHVSISTAGYTGNGSLELSLLGLANATPATATVSGFTGAFGADGDLQGSISGSFPGTLVFNNSGTNDFWRSVTLGGVFSFNVDFQLATAPGAGTTFAVSVANQSDYLTPLPVVTFELVSGLSPVVTKNPVFASVNPVAAVPEPASWALLLAGLGSIGIVRRRRA